MENIFFLNLLKTIKNFYNLNYIYLIFYIVILTFFINFILKKNYFSNEFKVFSLHLFKYFFFIFSTKFNIGSVICFITFNIINYID